MLIKKATACAAVFALLLLLGWIAERQLVIKAQNQNQMAVYRAYHYQTFGPREYVRINRITVEPEALPISP